MNTYLKTFHANISPSEGHPEDTYYFFAGGKCYTLATHDDESRARARAEAPHFMEIPDEALTHYTAEPVPVSNEVTTRVHFGRYDSEGIKIVHLAAMHIPEAEPNTEPVANPPIRPIRIGEDSFRFRPHHHIDWKSTAKTFLLHHPDVMSQDPEVSRIIDGYMDEPTMATYINNLAQQMRELGPPGKNSGWAHLEAMQIPSWGAKGSTNINYDNRVTGYQHNPVPEIKKTAGPALNILLKVAKNDNRLKNKKWRQASGTSVVSENGDNAHAGEFIAKPSVLSANSWNAQLSLSSEFHGLKSSLEVTDASQRKVKVTMNNYFVRYLSGYIQFYDASGTAISDSSWKPDKTDWSYLFTGLGTQYDNFRLLGIMSPINTFLAIPINSEPGSLEIPFTFPENATSARLYGCGLAAQGSNDYPHASVLASTFTGLFNLGIPGLMLAFAIGSQAYKQLYQAVEETAEDEQTKNLLKEFLKNFLIVAFKVTSSSISKGRPDYESFVKAVGNILIQKALQKIVIWIATQIATEEAAEEIPFVGWVLVAVNVAADVAQLAETIAETVTSPWLIENNISITAPCNVTVHPDPRNNGFPQGSSPAFTFKAIYKDTRPTITQHRDLSANFNDSTLAVDFTNHLGGQVKFEADFYLGDWLAAKATTGWMPNDLSHTSNVTLYLVQFPVPLTAQSVYTHQSRLFYENGTYEWHATSEACTATITSRNVDQNGYAIGDWNGLALSQRHGAIGWAWRAADTGLTACNSEQGGVQLYALQNVSIPGEQMKALKFSRCGFIVPTNIVYDVYPAKFLMENGNWVIRNGKPIPDPHDHDFGGYFLDPRWASMKFSEGGGYHLRRIDNLENSEPLVDSSNLSYGRFPSYPNPDQNNDAQVQPPNSITLHPSGHVIGVNSETCKIYILELETEGKADKDVPAAVAFGGQATHDDRAGLLMSPIAVTCSYEGTILILEKLSGGGRIQAFDLRGNPVNCFAGGSPFLSLPAGDRTYLDIAAVGGHQLAYVYVLYYDGSGNNVSDYHMDIYRYGRKVSGDNYLVGTEGVAAAKLAVDMWHTVYTLNFGPATDLRGNNAGHTTPSVSEWGPPTAR